MFERRTLFVLGAGASRELDLPTGAELAVTISKKMNISAAEARRMTEYGGEGDFELFAEFARSSSREISAFEKAFWLIRDGVLTQNSIDDFLDIHRDNLLVQKAGKAAIVKNILQAERNSKLFFDTSNVYNRMPLAPLADTWILKFMRVLSRGVALQDIKTLFNNVAFIVFNYDRCLEYFLFNALRNAYGLSEADAAQLLSRLTIIHPYGTAGRLKIEGVCDGVEFGGGRHGHHQHISLADDIKTYTEQLYDQSELDRIEQEVSRARRIVFLGFAFHEQNVALLRTRQGLDAKDVYATAFGMSESDSNIVFEQLVHLFDHQSRPHMRGEERIVIRTDLKCSGFFDQYTKSLPA